MRNTMKNFALGVALVAGLLGTGAAAANAAPQEFHGRGPERGFGGGYGRGYDRPVGREFGGRSYGRPGFVGGGVVVGGPVVDAYIPPCPGDGYTWTAGYYNGGIWVPGAWGFRGRVGFGRVGFDRGYGYGRDNRFVADRRAGGFERGFRGRR
jgi:hypothetical protein